MYYLITESFLKYNINITWNINKRIFTIIDIETYNGSLKT